MSAFIVTDRHLDYLISAAAAFMPSDFDFNDTAALWGRLEHANRASVNHRYAHIPEEHHAPRGLHTPIISRGPFDPVQVIKAVQCYEYQACEWPLWEDSRAHAFCRRLMGESIARLPGYEAALWAIPAEGV